ncbi:MAG: PAS domain S-box protein, partial [Candidatus Thermoplasmatota archaeon]|nr:PAS domain S-box protein [Candidatus Thermoplasmatota archaeon]
MKKKPAAPSGTAKLQRSPHSLLGVALIVAAYLCAFVILDFFSQWFEELRGIVAWYPPAGLTYTLLLVFGVGFTPAVTIALLIGSLFIYHMPQPAYLLFLWALIISLIYGGAAAFLRRRIHFDWHLRKLRDVTWLVVTAVLVSALLAILSVSSSALSSDMPQGEVLRAIFLWWIGETVGILTVTPFLLIHVMPWLKRFAKGQPVRLLARRPFPRPTPAVIGQVFSIALMFYLVFGVRGLDEFRPMYLITLPLIWIALRHGFRGVTTGILALNFGLTLTMWFFQLDLASLGELQLLMIINCIVGLLMGAVVTERKQAEEGLRDSEANFRAIFDRANDGILLADVETKKFYSGNITVCQILGYDLEEIKNLGVADIHPKENVPYIMEQFERQARKEIAVAKDIPVKRKDGSVFYADVNTSLVTLAGRTYLLGVFRDITEHRKAENALRESEEKYKNIIENSFDVIIKIDEKEKISYASPSMKRMFGVTPSEITGKNILDAIKDMFAVKSIDKPYKEIMGKLLDGEILKDVPFAAPGKSGSTLHLEVTAFPLFFGRQCKGIQGIIRDVTERKKAEETKIELEAMKHLGELKTRFVSTATHELRTPVVSIKGYTDLLVSGRIGEVPPKQKELLEVVSRNTNRLLRLVEDLLDIQRIESGRLKMEIVPMDLRDVIKQCEHELKPLMDEKKHTFTVQIPDH